jgi:hypothetical protein
MVPFCGVRIRDLVGVFALVVDPESKAKVCQRMVHLLEMEKQLEECVAMVE